MPSFIDMTGQVYGALSVIERAPSQYKTSYWKCRCECGTVKSIQRTALINGKTLSCGCKVNPPGESSYQWSGHREISGSYWSRLKKGALNRNLDFNITIEQAWEVFEIQERKCRLSGRPLWFGKTYREAATTTASLDRIDSTKPYTYDNIQWIHKDINVMKMAFGESYFIDTCKQIAEYRKHG